MIINKAARINFGFASNMALLLWCVCGGFLVHMLEANYLKMLMKPNYEKPVDTAQDVLDRNLIVIYPPGSESVLEILKNSPSNITRTLAERTIICWYWEVCDGLPLGNDNGLIPRLLKTGSSVYQSGWLYPEYLQWGKWHRSKERKGGENPFPSYMMNKKWTMEEEFTNHVMRFQQV